MFEVFLKLQGSIF